MKQLYRAATAEEIFDSKSDLLGDSHNRAVQRWVVEIEPDFKEAAIQTGLCVSRMENFALAQATKIVRAAFSTRQENLMREKILSKIKEEE